MPFTESAMVDNNHLSNSIKILIPGNVYFLISHTIHFMHQMIWGILSNICVQNMTWPLLRWYNEIVRQMYKVFECIWCNDDFKSGVPRFLLKELLPSFILLQIKQENPFCRSYFHYGYNPGKYVFFFYKNSSQIHELVHKQEEHLTVLFFTAYMF